MKVILLTDFGSTFTKLTAVDPEKAEIVGTASAFTTVETDINEGFENAFKKLEENCGPLEITEQKACSSAAGGLRMVVSGLVPELTAEAGRMAALGAGAKVIHVFHHEMTDDDMELLRELNPDIFLLTGGTDGGNSACILENAEILAEMKLACPIVVAGNRSATRKIKKLFTEAGLDFTVCPNVMPKLGELQIKPVQERIREIFLDQIIQAKGLSKIHSMLDEIIMPTPAAMLSAMKLLAEGTEKEAGIGELIAIDLGGATTDVYSIADGSPQELNTVLKGLPEPYEKRTVEGDIGMRYSLQGILDAGTIEKVAERSGLSVDDVRTITQELVDHKETVPRDDKMRRVDEALAATAVEIAVSRHCGTIEEVYTPMGQTFAQTGKDLRAVSQVIATGGALINSPNATAIVRHAAWSASDPGSLRPKEFETRIDRRYILSAMGVLSQSQADLALKIMKKELSHE